jgi:hypothetical protein
MRSASSAICLTALLALGCGRSADAENDEFAKVERALGAIGASPEREWLERLDDVKAMPLSSPRIAAIRDKCAAAYEEFGEATAGLAAAREDVARLEAQLKRGPDAGPDEAARLHAQALRATDGVTASLDAAERLVRDCEAARREVRQELGVP